MYRRLLPDRVDRPRFVEGLAALQPLEAAAGLRVGWVPVRPEDQVEMSVPVDVVGGDADVVRLRLTRDDRVDLPRRVLVPDDSLRIDHHDVRLPVLVDVRRD